MFEQSLLESAALAPSHRRLTTSIAALAQLALLSLAVLLPVFFSQNLSLLRPQAVMPMPAPRFTPPEPEPIERSTASASATTAQPLVMNVFPRVRSAPSAPSNPEAITLPVGASSGPVNYDLPIGVRDPATIVHGPSAPVISQLDEGRIIRRIQPVYPPLARAIRLEGEVLLEGVITRAGGIEGLKILAGHPMLASAAKDAVSQWQFRPYVLNGKPVDVVTQIRVNFKLEPR